MAGVGLSAGLGTAGALAAALDGQTSRLDQANGRTADVIQNTDDCDKRNADLLKSLTAKKGLFQ